ncbi:hypothetical protein, partial [Bacillus amyloliquefaciens]|uniref:hypothetical protein n=1 Tax=Bacillus amyloliquefaciens TaxID=1390 RepID=UPI00140557DF
LFLRVQTVLSMGLITINATFEIQFNTHSSFTATIAGQTVAPETLRVYVSGKLKIWVFEANFTGYLLANSSYIEIGVSVRISFFGIFNIDV